MSSELTPSTFDVKWRYEAYREQEHQRGRTGVTPVSPGEFDRWHVAELAAAWAEGHDAGWDERDEFVHYGAIPSGIHQSAAVNPYLADQAEEDQQERKGSIMDYAGIWGPRPEGLDVVEWQREMRDE